MGKASRRRRTTDDSGAPAKRQRSAAVPYVSRPFEGLPQETEWVAIREILPAATAAVTFASGKAPEGAENVTIATVLPMAWPALHRADGTVLIGTQSGSASGDPSRDLAAQILAGAAVEPGTAVQHVAAATGDTPRLQDLLDTSAPFEVVVHEGFEFWVDGQELDEEGQSSLDRANESVVPTKRMEALSSAYWVRIGDRTYIRLILPEDEDTATDALARLHAAGSSALGDGTRLLGAFRACGLLVPVFEVPADSDAADHEAGLGAFGERYAAALASTDALTAEERRARSGLLSRQVTLR
ncbi:hypothetical protein N802_04470 [Knoellia sinensis KCTC 19936]|uniref:DUF5926 domain-containing protein n=1 Tax=Knoellia sinensis KCTC 19936 TaxID=1385520 RepID=A0A0A0J1Q3_9MICO|nr:DUF5926 family protein [Knoellia sinensis]KGN31350.1 hypothetical protein N802_04470 [Knoellia sinensis KCTC 19936]